MTAAVSGARSPLRLGPKQVAVRAQDAAGVLRGALFRVLAGALAGGGLLAQTLLKRGVYPRAEYLAEYVPPLPRIGQQQLLKLALGQHRDLRKLRPVHADDVPHGGVDLVAAGQDAAVRQSQLRGGAFGRQAVAARLRALVLGVPADAVCPPAALEYKRRLGRRARLGVLRPQHRRVAAHAARLAVEGVGDRVEDRRLARAGVAGDEVQPARAEAVEGQGHAPGVGAERGDRER